MTDQMIRELFKRYKETQDVNIRNQITEHYLYIAEIIAKKFVGRGVEYDDLLQIARLALIRGIERFDPDLGMQFTTFITPTITGEIKNYFRDKLRMVKIPRQLGELNVKIKKFEREYEGKYGEKPSIYEIAEGLNVSEEEVIKALEVGGTISLDASTGGKGDDEENFSLYSVIADENNDYDKLETREALRAAAENLSEGEKLLLKYRYEDGLSQIETAKKLKVSQMYVSRMERRILTKLRQLLQDSF